jgi:hypothetical protein
MSNTIPSQLPGNAPGGIKGAEIATDIPSALPPSTVATGSGKCGCNTSESAAQAAVPAVGANISLQAPSLRPGNAGSAGAVSATWQSNVHIAGLWSINQDRNCWAYLDNVGWRNLSGASESGLVAMNMLAAHAYQLGSTTSLYEENDGRISQLYVW